MAKILPSARELKSLFEYVDGGDLRYKPRSIASFDARFAGRLISQSLTENGYRRVKVNGRRAYMQRVVWKMFNDTEPEFVDHINGDRNDNRINNLRPCTHSQNLANGSVRKGTSRFKGVRSSGFGGWAANIKVNKKCTYLGTFTVEADAARAYDVAALNSFGSFARTNEMMGLL